MNFKKVKRLFQKIFDKYFLFKHQEFGFITHYVKIHIRAAINSFLLKRSYTNINNLNNFIYFPLHVPGDAALTIRSSEYLDQISLIEYLATRIDPKFKLAIKEHPAQIGSMKRKRLKEALKTFDNIALIAPETNNYEVITKELVDGCNDFDQAYFDDLPFQDITPEELIELKVKYNGIPQVAWGLIEYWTKDIRECSDMVAKRRGYIKPIPDQ